VSEPEAPPTVHRLRALTVLLDEAAGRFAAVHGLSRTDVRALIALLDRERAGEAASPTWLARELGMTTASVTVLLDRLERAGHVRRRPRSDDRRRVDVAVEDSAKEIGWAFFGPLIEATREVLGRRSRAERAVVDAFLDDMLIAVGALGQDGRGSVTSGDGAASA
jgi:DNA-binding MarR family transcriptional regulator